MPNCWSLLTGEVEGRGVALLFNDSLSFALELIASSNGWFRYFFEQKHWIQWGDGSKYLQAWYIDDLYTRRASCSNELLIGGTQVVGNWTIVHLPGPGEVHIQHSDKGPVLVLADGWARHAAAGMLAGSPTAVVAPVVQGSLPWHFVVVGEGYAVAYNSALKLGVELVADSNGWIRYAAEGQSIVHWPDGSRSQQDMAAVSAELLQDMALGTAAPNQLGVGGTLCFGEWSIAHNAEAAEVHINNRDEPERAPLLVLGADFVRFAGTPVQAGGTSPGSGARGQQRGPRPARLAPEPESDISIIAATAWQEVNLARPFLEELRNNAQIREKVPGVLKVADDAEMKALELRYNSKTQEVASKIPDDSELAAIVAYTHDFSTGRKAGNLYYELNCALRVRGAGRMAMVQVWGIVVRYLLAGLSRLDDFTGTVYRGVPEKAAVLADYKDGRPVQWGAFTSTSTSLEAAQQFLADPAKGVIFKIENVTGKSLFHLSFFPSEDEILLSPLSRFFVNSKPYESNGFTMIDLKMQTGDVFVF